VTENATPTETADQLEGIALDGVAAYQTELQDGPVAARAAYRDSAAALQEMAAVGAAVGPQAATLRAEAVELARRLGANSENAKLKASEADALVADAKAKIGALSERSHALASVTEASLKASLIPALPDSGTRALARSEIDKATAGKTGAAAVAALRPLTTGEDAALTAELFDGYTARILGSPEHVQMFRALAVNQLLQAPSNARRAAQVRGLGKARGSIDAARIAALTRLR
jgi:hypothetical protein